MSLILYSIVMPFTLLVFIGFVLTIIHQFLVQEWIFAYFGNHLAFMEALKHVINEQWYVYRHKGSDDTSLVATLQFLANSVAHKQGPTGMELIEANMEHKDDLTLDDIREVLRLMQQEGMFDKKEKSSTPPLDEGKQWCKQGTLQGLKPHSILMHFFIEISAYHSSCKCMSHLTGFVHLRDLYVCYGCAGLDFAFSYAQTVSGNSA